MSETNYITLSFLLLGCFTGFVVGYAFGSPAKKNYKRLDKFED